MIRTVIFMVAALLAVSSRIEARLMGVQTIFDTNCASGVTKQSWPLAEDKQCWTTGTTSSAKVDCTNQKVTSFSNSISCASTSTSSQNFTCRSFNISGNAFGIGYSCVDTIPDNTMYLYTTGNGDCLNRGAVTLNVVLQPNKCVATFSTTNVPGTSFMLITGTGRNANVKTFFGNAFCNTTSSSNLPISLDQECTSTGGTYRLVVPFSSGTTTYLSTLVAVVASLVISFVAF